MKNETMKPRLGVSPAEPKEVTAPSGATSSASGAKNAAREGSCRTVLISLDRAGRGETPSLSGTAAVNAFVTDRPIDTRGSIEEGVPEENQTIDEISGHQGGADWDRVETSSDEDEDATASALGPSKTNPDAKDTSKVDSEKTRKNKKNLEAVSDSMEGNGTPID